MSADALPFTIVIDTREQTPFIFGAGVPTIGGTLATGDYSIAGLEDHVAIERKSLADFVACCGVERDRFKAELHRLQAYPCRAVVVEADMQAIIDGRWRSRLTPQHVLGAMASWTSRYSVSFVLAGDHGAAWTLAHFRNYHQRMVDQAKALGVK